MYAGIIIGIIAAAIIIWLIAGYNGFVTLKNKAEEAFSTMDVYLKKRYDLIPNLVATVKGYAAHESKTLESVISARNSAMGAKTVEDKLQNENILQGTLRSLFAVAESYPDLKANQNFLDLQGKLSKIEDEIANSRKYYNAVVKEFNTKTERFPSNLIAGMFHFNRRPLFEASAPEQRENVKVEF